MKSFKRTVVVLTTCCLWLFLGMIATSCVLAQEYRKEVFLNLPGGIYQEQGILRGPQSIGVDFHNNFYILYDGVLTQYNDEGEEVRKLTFTNPSRRNRPYYFDGFCFDQENNIYFVLDHASVYKSDPDGQKLEEMKCSVSIIGSKGEFAFDKTLPFHPHRIVYFPGSGLSLIGGNWFTFPLNFVNGRVIETEINKVNMTGIPLASGKHVSHNLLDNYKEVVLTIQMEDESQSSLHLTSNNFIDCEYIYSLDPEFEYYLITETEQTPQQPSYSKEIRKFNGEEFIFSTGTLPIHRIRCTRTRAVVDSRGTIYYFSGDDKEIQILRWVLE